MSVDKSPVSPSSADFIFFVCGLGAGTFEDHTVSGAAVSIQVLRLLWVLSEPKKMSNKWNKRRRRRKKDLVQSDGSYFDPPKWKKKALREKWRGRGRGWSRCSARCWGLFFFFSIIMIVMVKLCGTLGLGAGGSCLCLLAVTHCSSSARTSALLNRGSPSAAGPRPPDSDALARPSSRWIQWRSSWSVTRKRNVHAHTRTRHNA